MSEYIDIDYFRKVDLRIGEVEQAERVPGSDKLLKIKVNLGDEKRELVAGIAGQYKPEELIGRQIVVVVNLQPKKIRGIWSQGMLLAASVGEEGTPVLIQPEKKVPLGSRIT
jgi:methionyl-tRNA synthetase